MRILAVLIGAALFVGTATAQDDSSLLRSATGQSATVIGVRGGTCPTVPTVIYNTTRTSTQGAEITAAANGAATCMGDLVTLAALPERSLCEVEVDLFTLAAITPFDLTLNVYTACSSSGVAGETCGSGPGALLTTVNVPGITPPAALGTIFTVVIPVNNVDISGDPDSTLSFSLNASRNDVFWRLGETPTVGSQPAGEVATSVVERCGSVAANNGCTRNFGIVNNFAFTARATAGAGNLVITPASTDFGSVVIGATSSTSIVTLSNDGAGAVNVTAIDAALAPFASVAGGTCAATPFALAAGASCTVQYSFSPSAAVVSNQTINVTSNGTGATSFALTGTGTAAGALSYSSTTVDFGAQNTGSTVLRTLTLSNTGGGPLQITAVTAPIAPFAQTGGTCGATPISLAAGANCTIIYSFMTNTAGAFNQVINFTTTAGVVAIPLSANHSLALLLLLLATISVAAISLRRSA
jgi:hypothetical protein